MPRCARHCPCTGRSGRHGPRGIGDLELTYTSIQLLAFGGEGQIYGGMEGRLTGERISGDLQLTNLARRRPDDVNLPTLRGVLTTDDGAAVWVGLDGIATLRASDAARVFVTAFRFRTDSEQHAWLNTVVGVLEGVLDTVGRAAGRTAGFTSATPPFPERACLNEPKAQPP